MGNGIWTYKERLYYVIKTDDKFIQRSTTQLYPRDIRTRLVNVKCFVKARQAIVIDAIDGVSYEAPMDLFAEKAEIVHRFTINLN